MTRTKIFLNSYIYVYIIKSKLQVIYPVFKPLCVIFSDRLLPRSFGLLYKSPTTKKAEVLLYIFSKKYLLKLGVVRVLSYFCDYIIRKVAFVNFLSGVLGLFCSYFTLYF